MAYKERNFAEAAARHGFKRSRWRGLWRQTAQDQLIAALQNLKLLIRKGAVGTPAALAFLVTLVGWLLPLLRRPSSRRASFQPVATG